MKNSDIEFQPLWDPAPDIKGYPTLDRDIEADVAIIGGGITGVTAALLLSKAGKKVVLLEQYRIGGGTTGSSTGNLYAPIGQYLSSVITVDNKKIMKSVVESRLAAINLIKSQIEEYKIDCDLQQVPWHLFCTHDDPSSLKEINNEYEAAKMAGLKIGNVVPLQFPFEAKEILTVFDQAQINPLKYVQRLAASLNVSFCQVFEDSQVVDVQEGSPCMLNTALGSVKADKVIMATHSPKGIFGVQASMEPKREYALAVKLKGELPAPAIYWDINKAGEPKFSIRTCKNSQGNYLLVLHEQHKVGHMDDSYTFPDPVEAYLRNHFDVEEVVYAWSAQQYSSIDKLPFIGMSPIKRNVFIATGFAADGLVYGTLSAMIIKDAVLGIKNPWEHIYDPLRMPSFSSIPKFLKHNYEVFSDMFVDFVSSHTTEIRQVESGKGKVIKINGSHLAVYKDGKGGIYALSAICPHMGCSVHWNGFEKSWDCPCHGSRFSKEGEVLEGPAYKGLKIHYIKKGLP